jgi:phosphate uptake regulator
VGNKLTNKTTTTTAVKERNEEQRKIQVTGGATYIISLPKSWATRNALKRGSSMILREEEDGTLSISPTKFGNKEKKDEAYIRSNTNDNPDTIMRTAIAAYLNGYNIMHIRAQSQKTLSIKTRNHLKHFTRNYLVGTEIVTDTPNELTLQVLLNYPELTIHNALSRMSIIASSMQKEALTALNNLDQQSAKAVIETDREVNRFGLYTIRLLKLAVSNPRIVKDIGLNSQKECIGYRLIAKAVERTADHATKMAENTLQLKEQVNDNLLEKINELSTLANTMFENSIESLFKRDFNLAESVIEKLYQAHKFEKEAILLTHESNIEEIANIRLLIESVRRIAEYASDISEVVLNMTVESVLN